MSIKDVLDGLENGMDGVFTRTESDPVAMREPVLEAITRAENQWASPQLSRSADWFSEDNGTVAFTPTMPSGTPLTIDGLTTNFIPAERFADYLSAMRRQVEAGVFDAEIAAGMGGSPNVSGLATVPMPERRQGSVEEIRREQRAEAMRRDGRNPDGSIIHAVGDRPDVPLSNNSG